MDEYLSKPLKQNHLIQTILKCATLGGALLEKGRDVRPSTNDEQPLGVPSDPSAPRPGPTNALRRPISHGSVENPSFGSADQDDALSRMR